MALEPFQQRVVAEKAELDMRIERLRAFLTTEIFASLDQAEQGRMTQQLSVMRDYSDILGERIRAFG
jgi:hypothetical protein